MKNIKIIAALVLVFIAIACTPKSKPSFFGLSMGQTYQNINMATCVAKMAFELEKHDREYACQITPPVPNPLFGSYKQELSLKTKTLFRITAATQEKSGCDDEETVHRLLVNKYGPAEFDNRGRVWNLPTGIKVHLYCAKEYILPKNMTHEQYASIHGHVEFAEASCLIERAVNKRRCIDDKLGTQRFMAMFNGGEWPTIDDHLSLSYFDENTERNVANPEYEALKRAYLSQHQDTKGL